MRLSCILPFCPCFDQHPCIPAPAVGTPKPLHLLVCAGSSGSWKRSGRHARLSLLQWAVPHALLKPLPLLMCRKQRRLEGERATLEARLHCAHWPCSIRQLASLHLPVITGSNRGWKRSGRRARLSCILSIALRDTLAPLHPCTPAPASAYRKQRRLEEERATREAQLREFQRQHYQEMREAAERNRRAVRGQLTGDPPSPPPGASAEREGGRGSGAPSPEPSRPMSPAPGGCGAGGGGSRGMWGKGGRGGGAVVCPVLNPTR